MMLSFIVLMCTFLSGWRQPMSVAEPQRLSVLQGLCRQGHPLGEQVGWSWLPLAEPQPDPAQVGVPGTHLWPGSSSQRATPVQTYRHWVQVSGDREGENEWELISVLQSHSQEHHERGGKWLSGSITGGQTRAEGRPGSHGWSTQSLPEGPQWVSRGEQSLPILVLIFDYIYMLTLCICTVCY